MEFFCLMTGLRLSDIRSLTWANVQQSPDGNTLFIRCLMQKTQTYVNVPLSNEALNWMPKKEDLNEPVFSLPSDSNVERNIRLWMENVGIKKHLTFHCARHTFATSAIAAGGDLYTVCKSLGHKDIQTTQIYADVIMPTRIDAVNRVSDFFGQARTE